MNRPSTRPALFVMLSSLAISSCTDPEPTDELPEYSRVVTTRGSAIVLSRDERIAVATHRSRNLISVLRLNPKGELVDLVESHVEVDPGPDARPWACVMGADDDTAYVLLRGSGAVARVSHLRSQPEIDLRVPVGAEPTSIAITPSGAGVYVANWGDGTISWFSTANPEEEKEETDLNAALAGTGFLGPSVQAGEDRAWPTAIDLSYRPGLAHPRALAMTDDGDEDDEDETLYATEFFAQARPAEDIEDAADPDLARQGLVWAINMETGRLLEASPITLAPVNTGFEDSQESPTHCFPNQLYAAAVDGERLLVTAMCASPRGPVLGLKGDTRHLKTIVHPALFSVDVRTNQEVPGEALVLTRELETLYDSDDANEPEAPPHARRMPLIPNDIVLDSHSGERQAYVTALGAGAVFPIIYGNDGRGRVGSPGERFIPMYDLPVGIALSRQSELPFALVLSDDQGDRVSIIDRTQQRFLPGYSGPNPSEADELIAAQRAGRKLFATGLEVWSLNGQAWNSCESCHPDGLTDGVTWQFARGPRRSISTAGSYYRDQSERRLLTWTASIDEVHDLEGIARDVHGGVGGVVWTPYTLDANNLPSSGQRLYYNGSAHCGSDQECAQPKETTLRHDALNGGLGTLTHPLASERCDETSTLPCDVNSSLDWDNIEAFIRSVRAPNAPSLCKGTDHGCLNRDFVASGKRIFEAARCGACHGGPGWTLSNVFYEPGPDANGAVPRHELTETPTDTAPLLGLLRLRTYQLPSEAFRDLNPSASSGSATFRPAPAEGQAVLDFVYGKLSGTPHDQISCSLRAVGTFPAQGGDTANTVGIVASGAPAIAEIRQLVDVDPTSYKEPELALGASGYNIPSLVGLALGAPYFHAGNARTLEEVFDEVFVAHHAHAAILTPAFQPTPTELRDLVSYLLSIDENEDLAVDDSAAHRWPEPATWMEGDQLIDPDLCAQFER